MVSPELLEIVRCPLCRDEGLLQPEGEGLRCSRCGNAYARRPGYLDLLPPAGTSLTSRYVTEQEEMAAALDYRRVGPPLLAAGVRQRMLRRMLRLQGNERVLDCGCGNGKFALWNRASARLMVGLDPATLFADAALEQVDLLQAADKKIGAYSKGMRQRVKLAQAIAHDPDLLILDEPLSGMDPIARRRTIRFIREWARAGRSVLVSSHILHEVEAMTSDILLVHNGRILAEGNVHKIRELIDEHPHTVHVKSARPRELARAFLAFDHVINLKLEAGAVEVQTARPDEFYTALTGMAASGEFGPIDEVTSPDDNLQAVFGYLVK